MPAPLRAGSVGAFSISRRGIANAVLGAVLWIATPFAPLGAAPSFGSIEHVFLFMPLVAAPLALVLVSAMLAPGEHSNESVHIVVRRIQPIAAAMVLASFFVAKGPVAGGLAAGWFFVTLVLTIGDARRLRLRADRTLSNLSLLAAHVFLPIGAVWLLLSRLDVTPRHFTALTVFLAALHFHFSGFTLQILIAATGRLLQDRRPWLPALHRCLAIGAIAAIPLIAAGNVLSSPHLKFLGVSAMVLSTMALAIASATLAVEIRSRAPRYLLLVSAASIAAAMVLAGVYGVGELTGRGWIGIPLMVAIHGLLDALGFTLCGLLGHLHLRLATVHS